MSGQRDSRKFSVRAAHERDQRAAVIRLSHGQLVPRCAHREQPRKAMLQSMAAANTVRRTHKQQLQHTPSPWR